MEQRTSCQVLVIKGMWVEVLSGMNSFYDNSSACGRSVGKVSSFILKERRAETKVWDVPMVGQCLHGWGGTGEERKDAVEKRLDVWSENEKILSESTSVCTRYGAGGWVSWTAWVLSKKVECGNRKKSEGMVARRMGWSQRLKWTRMRESWMFVSSFNYLASSFRGDEDPQNYVKMWRGEGLNTLDSKNKRWIPGV